MSDIPTPEDFADPDLDDIEDDEDSYSRRLAERMLEDEPHDWWDVLLLADELKADLYGPAAEDDPDEETPP